MDEEQRKLAEAVFTSAWDITKRYAFIPLDDFLWEWLLKEANEKAAEFKEQDIRAWMLFRGIMGAVQEYKQNEGKEVNKNADDGE